MKANRLSTVILIAALSSSTLLAGQGQKAAAPAPDNTATNKTQAAKPTADQQKQDKTDLNITQQIRQLVTKDKALSTNAKNIKIITQNGNVTLAGPVGSEAEKSSVEAKAVQVAGAGHVKNEIQIAAKEPKK